MHPAKGRAALASALGPRSGASRTGTAIGFFPRAAAGAVLALTGPYRPYDLTRSCDRRSKLSRRSTSPEPESPAPQQHPGPPNESRSEMAKRISDAEWRGDLKSGAGSLKLGSGAFEGQYSYKSRFEDGTGTNPEELIA